MDENKSTEQQLLDEKAALDAATPTPDAPKTMEEINDDLNKTAETFNKTIPRIKALALNMDRNKVARVFSAIVEFPLAEKYPKFRTQAENELFVMSLEAMAMKTKMMNVFYKVNQQIQKETETAINSAAQAVQEDNKNE